jgi:hypothetical protein
MHDEIESYEGQHVRQSETRGKHDVSQPLTTALPVRLSA